MFKLVVKRGGQVVEEYDRATTGRGRQNVCRDGQRDASKLINIEEARSGRRRRRRTAGEVAARVAPPPPAALPSRGCPPTTTSATSPSAPAFGGLEAIDEVTMVCVPDLMSAYQQGAIDLETVQAVQLAMIAHCELMGDRIAILDPPPGLNAQQIKEWRVGQGRLRLEVRGAVLAVGQGCDPATGKHIFVPPSGHMAGIWGRNDDTRGVHKAPANEVVRGAISLEMQITRKEHDLLNPVGINCIRAFPGRGIRVWGARTLSSDPAWRYLNVRRLFNYLEESILSGTELGRLRAERRRAVGEDPPHASAPSWSTSGARARCSGSPRTRRSTSSATGRPTRPRASTPARWSAQIGVAPVKPAEFVIFRLSQFSGGTSLVAE